MGTAELNTEFDGAIEFLFEAEGYISDDPDDYGGLTKYGISHKAYPAIDIRALTKEQARQIYYSDYWIKMRCHHFANPLATVLFDTGVNCGVGSTGRWLQHVCNLKGSQLLIDGTIGSKTVLEVNRYDAHILTSGVVASRLKRYSGLVAKNKKQLKFLRGWVERVANLLFHVL